MLSDVSINWAQQIIKDQFPHLGGLQSSLLLQKTTIDVSVEDKIQIIHCRSNHWIVAASSAGCEEVLVYDSLFCTLDQELITNVFSSTEVKMMKYQK